MIRQIIICSVIFTLSFSAGIAPIPHCNSHPVTLQGPLSLEQKLTLHLDNVFSGYNLNLSIASNTSVARLTPKFQMISSMSDYHPRTIELHVQHNGNKWGKQAFILYYDTSSIVFKYTDDFSSSKVTLWKFTTIVQPDNSVSCFGAALLLDYGLAIIDCMKTTVKEGVVDLQNLFYYVDLTSGNITKKVKNSMYVPYKAVTQRKFIKFHDPHTGIQYLLRGYISNGVTKDLRGNTYFQIFSVSDPYNIQIMKVVDRTYLHIKTFQIVDIKIYLGDIFVLDPVYGLYRFDILRSNNIVVTGRIQKQGCSRFSVYSDDLQQQVIVALANSHAVYEIQWSDMSKPLTLTKYSLIQHSHIKQLIISKDFVIVQSSANATNDTNPNFQIDYTWIFSKGARTYTNAYQIINHNSSSVALDFNKDTNRLYVVDQNGRYLYQINQPKIFLELKEQSQIGLSQDLIVYAVSTDPNSNASVTCQVKTKINFVHPENQTIYNQSYETTKVYSAYSPGFLRINLDNYVLGPNITYSITNQSSVHDMPVRWIDKINLTKIYMQTNIGNVIFFHTTVIPSFGQERVLYYAQDSGYKTHVIQCFHAGDDNLMYCKEVANFTHDSQITTFTDAYFTDFQGWQYFYIMVFQSNIKQIRIYDYIHHSHNWTIQYKGQQQAEITSVASSNGFLYALRGAAKTIDVYRLTDCKIDQCKIHFQIDATMMKSLGVRYFTPLEIITDDNHPEVLFLRCRGSVVIIDIDNKQRITLLDEIIQSGTLNQHYRIAINKYKLTIVSNPDIVHIYSLEYIYSKNQVRYERKLPLYNHTIQATSDIQFSDFNDLVYINAVHPTKNVSVILVYRTSLPAALALYTQIQLPKLYSRPSLQIQVSGFYVDFLNIKTNEGFTLYRVFEQPAAIIKDIYRDYKFQLQFQNSESKLLSQTLEAVSVNYPTGFNQTAELNKTLNTLKLDTSANYTWDDKKWFVGHVTGYNFTCEQCGPQGSKVHLKQHVEKTRSLNFPAYDYAETITGGVAVLGDLFRFHINGSVSDVINLPDQKQHERCTKVAAVYHSDIFVSACQILGYGVNLYITSQSSYKSWTWGPYKSQAYRTRNLQIAGDIVMLADTSQIPEFRVQKGAVYLYSLDLDNESGNEMDQLQVIDEADLMNSIGYKKDQVFISNSHLVFSWSTSTYRLYITEIDGGFFVVDFKHEIGRNEINIISLYYIDMITLLEQNNLHMPIDGLFMAITLSNYKYNPHFYMESVIVTTKHYHSFEVTLVFDDNGKLLSKILHRVFQKYGFYQSTNAVKSSSGYFAMTYVLPTIYHIGNGSKQIVAVYDTNDYEDDHEKGYSERYMLGAARFHKTDKLMFSFNTTYDFRTNGTRTGLVITCPSDIQNLDMWEESISRNLTLELKKDFKVQDITLTAFSDFESKTFKMHLIPPGPQPQPDNQGSLVVIIIILAALITVGFIVYIILLVRNKKSKKNNVERVSLLTEGETIRQSVEPISGQYQPPTSLPDNSDSDSSQEEQKQEQEQVQPVLIAKPNELKVEQPQEIIKQEPTEKKQETIQQESIENKQEKTTENKQQKSIENKQELPQENKEPIEGQKPQN